MPIKRCNVSYNFPEIYRHAPDIRFYTFNEPPGMPNFISYIKKAVNYNNIR